ncbi:MAG: DUF4258 domain-containing protein [Ardenticatenia bacterium]|nr:DUF4258 domain-containing protein [Ardenticatenia bacterium]
MSLDDSEEKVSPLQQYRLTDHARFQMKRRGIEESEIEKVLSAPEQAERARPGRVIYQSRFEQQGRVYLLRVVVDVDREPAEVVTVYRTSKVKKYWRRV